jgi:hypothetical protein
MGSVAYGQSLGDIARENREKQNAEAAASTTPPKVITNKDLPKDPNPNPGSERDAVRNQATNSSKGVERSRRGPIILQANVSPSNTPRTNGSARFWRTKN